MARRKDYLVDVADENLTGFASNVTGATFTLTANVATDGLAHQVSIRNDSANNHSGKTVTLIGTGPEGNALTEVVTGPAGSATVESAGYFKTLTSATPSATIGADTFDIGWVDEVATPWFQLDHGTMTAAVISVTVNGTISFTVQETYNDVQRSTIIGNNVTALATKTAYTTAQVGLHATGVRLLVNSYSSGADLTMSILQERG